MAGPWLAVLGVLRIVHHSHDAAAWILGVLQCLAGAIIVIGFSAYLSKPPMTLRYDWRGRDRFKLESEQHKDQQGFTNQKRPR